MRYAAARLIGLTRGVRYRLLRRHRRVREFSVREPRGRGGPLALARLSTSARAMLPPRDDLRPPFAFFFGPVCQSCTSPGVGAFYFHAERRPLGDAVLLATGLARAFIMMWPALTPGSPGAVSGGKGLGATRSVLCGMAYCCAAGMAACSRSIAPSVEPLLLPEGHDRTVGLPRGGRRCDGAPRARSGGAAHRVHRHRTGRALPDGP